MGQAALGFEGFGAGVDGGNFQLQFRVLDPGDGLSRFNPAAFIDGEIGDGAAGSHPGRDHIDAFNGGKHRFQVLDLLEGYRMATVSGMSRNRHQQQTGKDGHHRRFVRV